MLHRLASMAPDEIKERLQFATTSAIEATTSALTRLPPFIKQIPRPAKAPLHPEFPRHWVCLDKFPSKFKPYWTLWGQCNRTWLGANQPIDIRQNVGWIYTGLYDAHRGNMLPPQDYVPNGFYTKELCKKHMFTATKEWDTSTTTITTPIDDPDFHTKAGLSFQKDATQSLIDYFKILKRFPLEKMLLASV